MVEKRVEEQDPRTALRLAEGHDQLDGGDGDRNRNWCNGERMCGRHNDGLQACCTRHGSTRWQHALTGQSVPAADAASAATLGRGRKVSAGDEAAAEIAAVLAAHWEVVGAELGGGHG